MHGLEEILEKVTRRAGDKVGAKLCFSMIGLSLSLSMISGHRFSKAQHEPCNALSS